MSAGTPRFAPLMLALFFVLLNLAHALPSVYPPNGELNHTPAYIEPEIELDGNDTGFALDKRVQTLRFEDFVDKGRRNLNRMKARRGIEQSVFTDYSALQDNGWDDSSQTAGIPGDLQDMYRRLNFHPEAVNNNNIVAAQDDSGRTRRAYGNKPAGTLYEV